MSPDHKVLMVACGPPSLGDKVVVKSVAQQKKIIVKR